jgi:hypothetical protein
METHFLKGESYAQITNDNYSIGFVIYISAKSI